MNIYFFIIFIFLNPDLTKKISIENPFTQKKCYWFEERLRYIKKIHKEINSKLPNLDKINLNETFNFFAINPECLSNYQYWLTLHIITNIAIKAQPAMFNDHSLRRIWIKSNQKTFSESDKQKMIEYEIIKEENKLPNSSNSGDFPPEEGMLEMAPSLQELYSYIFPNKVISEQSEGNDCTNHQDSNSLPTANNEDTFDP